jgi:GNAT superfamily N-acetyltransferase
VATLTIRPAVPADADVLTALMRSCATYRMAPYASVLDQVVVTGDRIGRDVAYTATDDVGEIVGFYILIRDPPELDMLFVSDAAQGQGIGRQLVEHMLVEARKAGLAGVRVVSHPPAEGFYRRLGAEWTDTVPVIPPTVTWERPAFTFRL